MSLITREHDIYIDSESLGSYNDFIVYLPYPIEVGEEERAYIRLKDYQQLNSFYNISNDLQNNTFTILHTTRTYNRTASGADTRYIIDTNLFQTSGGNIYKPILNSVQDALLKTETLTPNAGNFTIKLYDSTINASGVVIPANSKFMNIFSPTPSPAYLTTRFMAFSNTDYLVYYNAITPTESRFVKSIDVVIENVAAPLTPESNTITITVKVWGSVDGISWIDLGNTTTNVMTYAIGSWLSSTTRVVNFEVAVSGSYQFHKVSFIPTGFTSPTEMKTKIKFLKVDLITYASYTQSIADSTITYSKTIEDGFYSLTNLNALLNYYLKLHISGNLTFSNYVSGKPFLTAQNKQVLGWSSAEPYYYYKETDKIDESYKVEIQFNLTLRKMLGWITPTSVGTIILFRINDNITSPNYLNLINFKKILLTSSLKLKTKPYTFLNKTYTKASGIGDVFAWLNKDIAPFQYINWTNPTDSKIEIDDKVITKINFKVINEFAQVLNDMPACNFHMQIIIEKEK
jgi:hypothetical protein